jgi:hypothetical protein
MRYNSHDVNHEANVVSEVLLHVKLSCTVSEVPAQKQWAGAG